MSNQGVDHGFQLDDPAIEPEWNALTHRIIGCAIEVHKHLGPGLLERLYEDALCHELRLNGLSFVRQRSFKLDYKGIELNGLTLDLLVETLVVVELKSIETVAPVHLATLVSYMRSAGAPLGLLINFNHARLINGVYRRANTSASAPVPSPSSPRSSASPRSMSSPC